MGIVTFIYSLFLSDVGKKRHEKRRRGWRGVSSPFSARRRSQIYGAGLLPWTSGHGAVE
jgi:hypothetical protein